MKKEYPYEQFEAINDNRPQKMPSFWEFLAYLVAFWLAPYLALIISE